MNRLTLIALAGLSLTSACATQPPQQASFETTASLLCQHDLEDDGQNFDLLYLRSGRPAIDDEGHTYGLSLMGHVNYMDCMAGRGYDISNGAN